MRVFDCYQNQWPWMTLKCVTTSDARYLCARWASCYTTNHAATHGSCITVRLPVNHAVIHITTETPGLNVRFSNNKWIMRHWLRPTCYDLVGVHWTCRDGWSRSLSLPSCGWLNHARVKKRRAHLHTADRWVISLLTRDPADIIDDQLICDPWLTGSHAQHIGLRIGPIYRLIATTMKPINPLHRNWRRRRPCVTYHWQWLSFIALEDRHIVRGTYKTVKISFTNCYSAQLIWNTI